MLKRSGILFLFIFAFIATLPLSNSKAQKPLQTVSSVDLNKYSGKWYEIARFPNRFQRKCVKNVTADYVQRPDGKIKVLNECEEASGKKSASTGTAKVADKNTNAKLKVTFFWPFSGDYWIIALGQNYEYAVVGEPTRKYLWVLSRSSKMDDATYERLLKQAADQGFDTSKLVKTPQA